MPPPRRGAGVGSAEPPPFVRSAPNRAALWLRGQSGSPRLPPHTAAGSPLHQVLGMQAGERSRRNSLSALPDSEGFPSAPSNVLGHSRLAIPAYFFGVLAVFSWYSHGKGKLARGTNLSRKVDTCSKSSSRNKGKSKDKRLRIMPTSSLTLYQLSLTRTWRCGINTTVWCWVCSRPPVWHKNPTDCSGPD